jgi:adenylosuccinate lyase
MRSLALEYRATPALAYTHYQPAQPTTVGKRIALWASDLVGDLEDVRRRKEDLRFLGAKGATGTQASFLLLFDGDAARVEELDRALARRAGFPKRQIVSGQTYSRKQDDRVVHALSGLAQSAHKIGTDLRLLQHDGEIEEPFESTQVGSSAMPYKRNPMRAERICSLARHVIALSFDTAMTAATQWLERTLDDSANRRIAIPEAFLTADAILVLLENVFSGLVVHADVARRRLEYLND